MSIRDKKTKTKRPILGLFCCSNYVILRFFTALRSVQNDVVRHCVLFRMTWYVILSLSEGSPYAVKICSSTKKEYGTCDPFVWFVPWGGGFRGICFDVFNVLYKYYSILFTSPEYYGSIFFENGLFYLGWKCCFWVISYSFFVFCLEYEEFVFIVDVDDVSLKEIDIVLTQYVFIFVFYGGFV